ncbi:NAD-dependent epimerase/dehydratase family protein [Halogeometricum borinquense]|uniref:NAD-dependent epimerase/dehydratase family protein n=1 Tax=Halogeometricum borinquense TaxID=60847 RepID=A0A482T5E6_9EURY|nr:NAD(P)H-binding protein [Halogeometricum borinquense]RYJ08087.1 NAD-dependent epimerase/dehydratase family protein [Halogeometricum borinquense]
MRIAVFGATGRTGQPLVEQAVERGHEVVAFVRDATGLSSTLRNDDRVSIVEGDAYTGESVERAIAGVGDPVDAVVSVLAQTSDGPDDLLTEAGRHMLSAMNQHDVERFVTLVGAGVREEGESVSLGGRMMGTLLKLLARSVLEDARDQVELIKESDTRWTVVRGPRLTEDAHTGELRHGTDLSLGMRDTAARANVAEFILDCLEDDLYVREMPKVADA